jgi:isopentenyl diphosphate isomerase/L-lactate dehydrogenase-like FMN-dependent dehydrogenase
MNRALQNGPACMQHGASVWRQSMHDGQEGVNCAAEDYASNLLYAVTELGVRSVQEGSQVGANEHRNHVRYRGTTSGALGT